MEFKFTGVSTSDVYPSRKMKLPSHAEMIETCRTGIKLELDFYPICGNKEASDLAIRRLNIMLSELLTK